MAERKRAQGAKSILNDKRRIAQRLIGERLGIEHDWDDAAETPATPGILPDYGEPKLSVKEAFAIEGLITTLINLGCNPYVVYWCIQQMVTDANLLGGGASMATREDMVGLSKRVRGAEELIHKYANELLLVAEACPSAHPVRRGWETDQMPPASETMLDLLDHLAWVKGLAEAWRSPNVNSLMKKKGLLYLLAYVWLHSQEPHKLKAGKKQRKYSRQTPPDRLSRDGAAIVAAIAFVYRWKGAEGDHERIALQDDDKSYSAEDLQDKLQDFCTKHPSLFTNMLSLLKALDKNVASFPLEH